ncbi:unnamed protein product [Paramecium pentaurelia]|uniref:MORN repeat protein n=1 Tax=Paramecium pentaurelia TaxID=43138 RepID=A0A8S1XCF2_9CILI|nr:unnamed protein product [Paramecium pentaurelia]
MQDEEILRCDEIQDYNDQPQIMKNLEQIRHLIWHGSYNLSAQKEGKWYPTWKEEKIDAGGTYINQKEQRMFNGQNQAKIFGTKLKYLKRESILIIRDVISGSFSTIINQSEGLYSQNGLKNGRWSDLHDNYHEGNKVILNGEYLVGQKVKKWNIVLKGTQIGNGYYDENGIKTGEWVELDDQFEEYNSYLFLNMEQMRYQGKYVDGIKTGIWKRQKRINGKGNFVSDDENENKQFK